MLVGSEMCKCNLPNFNCCVILKFICIIYFQHYFSSCRSFSRNLTFPIFRKTSFQTRCGEVLLRSCGSETYLLNRSLASITRGLGPPAYPIITVHADIIVEFDEGDLFCTGFLDDVRDGVRGGLLGSGFPRAGLFTFEFYGLGRSLLDRTSHYYERIQGVRLEYCFSSEISRRFRFVLKSARMFFVSNQNVPNHRLRIPVVKKWCICQKRSTYSAPRLNSRWYLGYLLSLKNPPYADRPL